MSKIKIYIISIMIPLIIGGLIGLIISPSIDYETLNKPILAPSGNVFPIVWTIIYILMGISYGILKSKKLNSREIDYLYYVQLALNGLWSIFFFILKWRLFSSIWIIILTIVVVLMIIEFYRKNKISGLLQIPYLLWLLFAYYLNLSIYVLNK